MVQFLGLAKLVFFIVLAILFLYFFGYPALQQYLEKAVLIKISTVLPSEGEEGLLPPAITICPLTPVLPYPIGWKNSSGEFLHVIETECNAPKDYKDVIICIENKTYKLNETILSAFDGTVNPRNLLNMSHWTSDLTVTTFGMCHTMEYKQLFSADFQQHSIWFTLRPDLVYDVYFHDSKFFLLTNNLVAIPQAQLRKKKNLQTNLEFDFYPIVVCEHRNLNRPNKPCVDDPDHNFMTCIKNSLATKIGCRLPWDNVSNNAYPICKTIEQIRDHEAFFFNISKMELKDVLQRTRCKVPCHYKEYKIFNKPMESMTEGFGIGMMFPSTEITLEEEVYVYPFISFMAEFGGALGMFLGFSFFMLWDLMLYGFLAVIKYMKLK